MGEQQQSDTRSTPRGVTDAVAMVIPVAVWFGLLTGMSEVVLRAVRRRIIGRFSDVGQQVVWMAPLADVLIFGALGVLLYVLARRRRDPRWLRAAITLYAFLAALAVLMMYYPLHPWARLALAAGIAVQFRRLAFRWRGAFTRLVETTLAWPLTLWRFLRRRLSPRGAADDATPASPTRRDFLLGTGATLGVLAAGVHGPPLVEEWSGVRRLRPARPGAPNVILVVLDTVRAASLSLHGYHRETSPALEQLAGRGAFFTRAYSHSPWTLPSHGSLFTGRYPHELSGGFQRALDARFPVLAEVLGAAGYATAGFVANTGYCSYESGLNRGFLHYEDYTSSLSELVNSSVLGHYLGELPAVARRRRFEFLGRRPAASISRKFLSWAERQEGHPFFAFLNYFEAHAPYLPPPPFDTRFGPAVERPNSRHSFFWNWTREQQIVEQNAYDGAIACLDAEIGALMADLEHRGLLENTLVIITSDHGELFGEHGLMDHANSLYAPLLHVPLLMIWPGHIPAGLSIDEPIGLRHIAATIADLTDIDAGGLRGHSLAAFWQGDEAGQHAAAEPVLASLEQGIRVEAHWRNARGSLQSLIADDRHYIRNSDGSEELYDLAADPVESTNIAGNADTGTFRDMLDRMLRQGSS